MLNNNLLILSFEFWTTYILHRELFLSKYISEHVFYQNTKNHSDWCKGKPDIYRYVAGRNYFCNRKRHIFVFVNKGSTRDNHVVPVCPSVISSEIVCIMCRIFFWVDSDYTQNYQSTKYTANKAINLMSPGKWNARKTRKIAIVDKISMGNPSC